MKLKLLTGLSGPEFALSPGDERDFADDEALRLIDAGIAERAEPAAKAATPKTKG